MEQILLLVLIVLIVTPLISAEIEINTLSTSSPSQADQISRHTFFVSTYQMTSEIITAKSTEILIIPIISLADISQCKAGNFSFKLINPSSVTGTYLLSIRDFSGIAYFPQAILIPGRDARIIHFRLEPDCMISGNINPKLTIETTGEIATLPVILKIQPTDQKTIEEVDCNYYYNDSICNSRDYIRFYGDKKYELDLAEYFYDPDCDKLTYSIKNNLNLDVKIKGDVAEVSSRKGFSGPETITFVAEDGNGGKSSRSFYFHVLAVKMQELPYLLVIGGAIILVLLLLIIIVGFGSAKKQESKEN